MTVDRQPVDLLERPRSIGEKYLPGLFFRCAREGAFLPPRGAVGLPRHIGKRIKSVLRLQLDRVDRCVAWVLPLLLENFRRGRDTRRAARTVPLGLIQRMRAELLDVYRDRCSDPLGAKHVEPCWRAIRSALNGKPYLARALFEVTSGGVFWIVAVGPARWTMRGLGIDISGGYFRRLGFYLTLARFLAIWGKDRPFGGIGQL